MSDQSPALLDCRGICDELGVKRATADAIMRKLEKVIIDGHRRVFVRRADVLQLIAESTVTPEGFPKQAA